MFYADGRELSKNYAEAYKWAHLAAVHGDPKGGLILDILVQKITGDHIFEGRKNAAALARDEIEKIRTAAEAGNDRAQIHMGTCYELGCGAAQDYTQAVHWYRKAAEKRHANAQCNLALCYNKGKGVIQDFAEAVYWWRKAADQGHADAQYFLASSYFLGRGIGKDPVEAYAWANIAAASGKTNIVAGRNVIMNALTPRQLENGKFLEKQFKEKIKPQG